MNRLAPLLLLTLALGATAYLAFRSVDEGAPAALPADGETEAPESDAPEAPESRTQPADATVASESPSA